MKVKNNLMATIVVISIMILISACSASNRLNEEYISRVNSADGTPISYGVRGKGDVTLVFIHGWTGNSETWKPQLESFSAKHKVVWLDLAGHGLSSSNRQTYTMSAFGEDVNAVVNDIGADKVILVGHSMGGPVAIEAAKLLGDKVIGIVGVDSFYTAFQYPTSEQQINGFMKPFKDDFKGTSEQLLRSMFTAKAGSALITSIVDQTLATDEKVGISALHELLIWNMNNNPTHLGNYAKKLRNINATPTGSKTVLHESVILIPDVGHFIAQVKPNEFNKALSEIISEYQLH